MTAFVRTDTLNDTVLLHFLQMFGYSTTVDAEAFGHLGRSNFSILDNHIQNDIASFLSTFSVHF